MFRSLTRLASWRMDTSEVACVLKFVPFHFLLFPPALHHCLFVLQQLDWQTYFSPSDLDRVVHFSSQHTAGFMADGLRHLLCSFALTPSSRENRVLPTSVSPCFVFCSRSASDDLAAAYCSLAGNLHIKYWL